jgi:hypothetical protein
MEKLKLNAICELLCNLLRASRKKEKIEKHKIKVSDELSVNAPFYLYGEDEDYGTSISEKKNELKLL